MSETVIRMGWKEARSAAIQDGGNYIVRSLVELNQAIDHLETQTTAEDAFDLLVEELDSDATKGDAATLRVLVSQDHGYPNDLKEQLSLLFE